VARSANRPAPPSPRPRGPNHEPRHRVLGSRRARPFGLLARGPVHVAPRPARAAPPGRGGFISRRDRPAVDLRGRAQRVPAGGPGNGSAPVGRAVNKSAIRLLREALVVLDKASPLSEIPPRNPLSSEIERIPYSFAAGYCQACIRLALDELGATEDGQ